MKKSIFATVFVLVMVSVGVYVYKTNVRSDAKVLSSVESAKLEAHIYKSPNCGCCVSHSSYLRRSDFDVTVEAVSDISSIKQGFSIPYEMQSCHTTVIGDYFVEGHVPIEAIDKLLTEKPDIDGISLPEMPAGSPGMPGVKEGEFIIYSLKDGETSEFMRI